MTQRESVEPRTAAVRPRLVRAIAALVVTAGIWGAWWWQGAAAPSGTTAAAAHPAPVPAERLAAAPGEARDDARLAREEVTPPAPPPPGFEAMVDELCTLGARTAELAEEDEFEQARVVDQQARRLLARLFDAFADAGERGLAMVSELAAELAELPADTPRPPLANTRLGVLQLIVSGELARRHDLALRYDEHQRTDALVTAVLDTMPIGAVATEMGDRLLHRRPYLRLAHEPMVLHLLQLAGADAFPRDVATHLLLTLWDNLAATGTRSSDELSQLALFLLDDRDPSQVVVACRQLLRDARYRGLVIGWLRQRDDPALADTIARVAGRELPPADALEVLRELSPLLQHVRGTFLGLGVRAPEVVADAYREHLASDTHPALRRELVMGVGMLPDPVGLPIAELALANDPAVEVRMQAMFVLTVHGSPERAEQAVHQLLDDPVVAGDPMHLASVVLALQNLEHGDPNTLARLGARLGTLPLAARSRELLDEILARSVPGASGGR